MAASSRCPPVLCSSELSCRDCPACGMPPGCGLQETRARCVSKCLGSQSYCATPPGLLVHIQLPGRHSSAARFNKTQCLCRRQQQSSGASSLSLVTARAPSDPTTPPLCLQRKAGSQPGGGAAPEGGLLHQQVPERAGGRVCSAGSACPPRALPQLQAHSPPAGNPAACSWESESLPVQAALLVVCVQVGIYVHMTGSVLLRRWPASVCSSCQPLPARCLCLSCT